MTRLFTIYIAYLKRLYSRRLRRPYEIYHNVLKAAMPSTLDELETLMKMARRNAEQLCQRKRWKIEEIMSFSIHRQGFGKGRHKTEFVTVYKLIQVDTKGRIVTMTAPRQAVNPEAYRIYLEYHRRKALASQDREEREYGIARYMGIRLSRPEVKLGRITKFKDKDPYDVDILDLFDAKVEDVETYFSRDNIDDVRLIKIDIKPIWETVKDRHRLFQKDDNHIPFYFG